MNETHSSKTNLSFTEYIRKLPAAWIFSHFLKNAASGRKILSLSAAQDHVKSFSLPESLIRQYRELKPDLQLRCALTYLHGESGLPIAQDKISLDDDLIRSFLVYGARNTKGALRYFSFAEFEAALRPLCAETLCQAMALKESAVKVKPPAPRHGNALNDVVAITILAGQGILERKKAGGLTSGAQTKIHKLLPWPAHLSASCGNFLVAYCIHAGILCEGIDCFHVDARQFGRWLEVPEKEQVADLGRFAQKYCGNWNVALLHELFSRVPGTWFSIALFPEQDRAAEALRILHISGFVEFSHAGPLAVFGAPPAHEQAAPGGANNTKNPVIVLPDFTTVLSQEVLPWELAFFGSIGELLSLDRVYKGTISRNVIHNSLSANVNGDTMISALTRWQAPGNVIATVREWIREFYRLYVTDGQMLVVADEKVAAQIRNFPPLHEYIEPMPVHALFRIHGNAGESVKAILEQMGFDHRMPGCGAAVTDANQPEKPVAEDRDAWEPIVAEGTTAAEPTVSMRGKKYGTGLKKLDLNETMHIIDYAILTGQELSLDYAGSPLVRKGLYSLVPRGCSKGADPLLEGTLKNGFKKLFHVRRIDKIGVGKP
ncbi:MAG: hypothetical protein MUF22_02890 [Chitinispirillaceae bacterium]|nr:hypothetical protein [Chitinispirillaceae bacterium]